MFEYFIGMFLEDEVLKAYSIKARLAVQCTNGIVFATEESRL